MTIKKQKTRSSYETEFLSFLKLEDIAYGYETKKLKLVIETQTSYMPDVIIDDINIEIKAPHRYAKPSLIKLANAVEQYPYEVFIMVARDLDKPIPQWKSMTLRKFCDKHNIYLMDLDDVLHKGPASFLSRLKDIKEVARPKSFCTEWTKKAPKAVQDRVDKTPKKK
jgi:hypothetical protein